MLQVCCSLVKLGHRKELELSREWGIQDLSWQGGDINKKITLCTCTPTMCPPGPHPRECHHHPPSRPSQTPLPLTRCLTCSLHGVLTLLLHLLPPSPGPPVLCPAAIDPIQVQAHRHSPDFCHSLPHTWSPCPQLVLPHCTDASCPNPSTSSTT